MTGTPSFADERGTTLMEVIVALAAGTVILAALSMVIVVSLRESGRINARVDANQRARLALNKVIDQLHSACIAPQIAPIKEESNGTELIFIHQTGSAVAPVPVKSKVSLVGNTLTQSDFNYTTGTVPFWEFATTASKTTPLMTKISPTAPSSSIFSYYGYTNGQISPTPLATPLSKEGAERAVMVSVALTAAPLSTPVKDSSAAASIRSTALLRLTPPSFSAGAVNLPCQ